MQLNTTTEYAISTLTYLAVNPGVQSIFEVSQKTGITEGYLAKVFRRLRNSNIVEARLGVNGGYLLKKPAEKITLYEIISVMEKTVKISKRLEKQTGSVLSGVLQNSNGICQVYEELQTIFENKMQNVTVYDLAGRNNLQTAREDKESENVTGS